MGGPVPAGDERAELTVMVYGPARGRAWRCARPLPARRTREPPVRARTRGSGPGPGARPVNDARSRRGETGTPGTERRGTEPGSSHRPAPPGSSREERKR